jgi:hypothetical protein
MKYFIKIVLVILALSVPMSLSGSEMKKKPSNKKMKEMVMDQTKLGKNKLFFSKKYQKKLKSRAKKHRR